MQRDYFYSLLDNNITVIIYSTLLSFLMLSLITKLSNSTNSIRNIFREEEKKIQTEKNYIINAKRKNKIFLEIEKILKKYKIKILFLIIIDLIFILFFWYFVTAFCHVYSSTQTSWLFDTFLSILSRFILELLFALLFSKLYILSIESNIYTLYKIVLFIYDFS